MIKDINLECSKDDNMKKLLDISSKTGKSELNSAQMLKIDVNNEYSIEFKYKDIKHKIKYKPNETKENILINLQKSLIIILKI